ncbi:hypothetical protein DQ353_00170 [Arthrobacter sp. AQ5-05]|uniref:right-handed parallel beta-helix repeat-containing protein n=1 Tax=Arthrobacter sp. AQ5-05 TaxID=2184581 RepID=UPI000DCF3CCB|nr:right-handed parallel beta-helix repeat-containing protein [Arthrobacter sp. AQ5-05]RAX50853.1 hypothetical protein DQ353_00170 [Arthrobacter sp. AQ5-05]
MATTVPHSIHYPQAADLIKDPNSTAKLAVDLMRIAVSTNSAISNSEGRSREHANTLDSASRNAWGSADSAILRQALEYTDNAFSASGPGGATDAQLDAAVDRAVQQGRVADAARLPSKGRTAVGRGDFGVVAEDHGAVGDGVFNDWYGISAALRAANGNDVILKGGTVYKMSGTLVVPDGQDSVSIRAVGSKPAVLDLGSDGQSYPAIRFDAGEPVTVKTLTVSTGINSRGWMVNSTTGIQKGMLCEVVSSAPWYHDPRPESAPLDARKSELHRVQDTFDGRVWMDDPANDGYDLTKETIELRFYKPIRVRLENITVRGTLPAVGEETKAVEGIVVQGADQPLLIDVNAENCARTGIAVSRSWAPRVLGGYTRKANNFYNGYGVSIRGCAHGLVDGRHTHESNKGVDVTGFNCISRHTIVQNCKTFGGGRNSRGEHYGWNPDGSFGTQQSGYGNHGAADNTTYRFNTVIDVWSPFGIRGRNTYIHDNLVMGRTSGGVVRAYLGTNLYVTNNRIIAGYWSLKPSGNFGGPNIDGMRADTIVTVYDTWQSNPPSGIRRGQLVVTGNEAELRTAIVRMHMLHRGEMYIANNRGMFMDTNLPRTCYVLDNSSGSVPTTGEASAWTLGPNDFRSPGNTVTVQRSNTSVAGAKVLDYGVAT